MSDDLPFAVVLRRARVRMRVSQVDMARVLGISPACISRFECSTESASESTVRRYAAALGLRPVLRLEGIERDSEGDDDGDDDGDGEGRRRKAT